VFHAETDVEEYLFSIGQMIEFLDDHDHFQELSKTKDDDGVMYHYYKNSVGSYKSEYNESNDCIVNLLWAGVREVWRVKHE